jgi:hypothetical protein
MSKTIKISLALFPLLTITGYVLFIQVTPPAQDWNFIQKVGGIQTENPIDTQDGSYLPVVCNISGIDSITFKPTQMNSAISCKTIKVERVGNNIYQTVITGLLNSKNTNCNCKAPNIGRFGHESYKDNSSSEHQIGQFNL